MINNNVYSSLLFVIVYSSLLTISCCKQDSVCHDAKNTIVDFTNEELSKVPYNGFDTLYFLDQNGDTNIVHGTGKQFYYDTQYGTVPPECPANQTIQNQAYKINFVPIKGDLIFTIVQQKSILNLLIDIGSYPVLFKKLYLGIGNPPYYKDSIEINNVYYYEIMTLPALVKPDLITVDNTYSLLYNPFCGILSIKSQSDNKEYSILKK